MKRIIARALRRLANHLDPSRGWTVNVEHARGAAGRNAGDEFRQRVQAPGNPFP
ncbi:Uncharacterised protein [Mycobacteroides abscessus]|uniref:Uncharacterized protein n=1 Tax=Mycobacteroides abscessus TaxID=36809 RepID=A0A0U0ZPN0_9MYCO|nr:hypothetical protein [Mycobacteroides abscessus]MDM2170418.1 hypothetical protein [Mycobacteroides abscessus]CPU63088.1 Uncharacterised protein [Mycobacteroides abscessus]CPV62825.1 Uncharacterised protein [Mycobacteroides abscessus]